MQEHTPIMYLLAHSACGHWPLPVFPKMPGVHLLFFFPAILKIFGLFFLPGLGTHKIQQLFGSAVLLYLQS